MLYGFISRVSQATNLKAGLDISSQRTRAIADRVAKASIPAGAGFALPNAGAAAGSSELGPVNLEAEMVSLADEQIRFETTARLLQKTYQGIRASIRDR